MTGSAMALIAALGAGAGGRRGVSDSDTITVTQRELGQQLAALRREAGLTQEDLAALAGRPRYYDKRRAVGDRREAALRRLASKVIGQLHHCLARRVLYDETTAWSQPENQASSRAA